MREWIKISVVLLGAAGLLSGCANTGTPGHPAAPQQGPVAGRDWESPAMGMEFAAIEPGSFEMGSNNGASDEKPVHQVTLTQPFWLAKTEVTQAQWQQIMGSNPSRFKGSQNPVEQVSWNDAVAFCQKLTERERQAGRLPESYEYTLPTEAQWEYAARGGHKSRRDYKYAGSDTIDRVAWHYRNSGGKTHPVGKLAPNELGIYDMSGNVWEWCLDLYDGGFYGKGSDDDPVNTGSGSIRVLRGGGWFSLASYCRSAYRYWYDPSDAINYGGFRVCLVRK